MTWFRSREQGALAWVLAWLVESPKKMLFLQNKTKQNKKIETTKRKQKNGG